MKIVSYNIMSGGFNSYNYHETNPPRLDLLVEAVNKLNADFVSLIDTFRWDELFSENDLKSLFHYKYSYCINLEDDRLKKLGHNNGITVLTNESVVGFETIRLSNRNAIKTKLRHQSQIIDLFSVYLDDLSEDSRLDQANALLGCVDFDNPTIIMGDLNTFSPTDVPAISAFMKTIRETNPALSQAIYPIFMEMQRAQVTTLLEGQGFHDTNTRFETTAPSPLFPLTGIPAVFRLDYIFTRKLTGKNTTVYKDKFFDAVSDHYPISVDIFTPGVARSASI